MSKKGYEGFSVDNINDSIGPSWGDLDCIARNVNDVIYDPQVFPIVGESIDGDFNIVGFGFC